jgi:hypothetical protein
MNRTNGTTWLAVMLWVLTVAFTALSLVFLALILRHPGVPVFDWWAGNATIVIDVTVGAIIASRRPENLVGWLLCISGLAVSTSSFASQYAIYALVARPGSLPLGEVSAWIAAWILPVIIGVQLYYLLLFPTGRLPGRRWRWLALMIGAFIVVGVFTSAFSPGAYLGSLGPVRNPLGIGGFTSAYKMVLYVVAPILQTAVVFSLFARMRRADGIERQQIKWLAYAAALLALGIICNVINLAFDTPRWFESAATAYFTVAGTTTPIAIGIAILRYRLYDIDRLINRTLVYGALTVTLGSFYLGGVAATQALFRALTDQERLSQLAVVASTLAIAALFYPSRRRIQSIIDRSFYRRKYDAAKTLEEFGTTLRAVTDLDGLANELTGVIRETVQPAHVSLWLAPDRGKGTDDRS